MTPKVDNLSKLIEVVEENIQFLGEKDEMPEDNSETGKADYDNAKSKQVNIFDGMGLDGKDTSRPLNKVGPSKISNAFTIHAHMWYLE
jgi:hypothetical protein